ncbi:hypothetical protein FZ983_12040 [Azospirillum sp. B21]|uniref:hypothetical protein n=1 Tax=Azospirillum sp. B21 TaxID=2607496 RepID=UPI0011ECD4D2|nr:hypothetical protein [Azospirillum sp. B21]KAA0580312.1 hypothetical protein FZ983_12040 [Azospirillum sp. B21]
MRFLHTTLAAAAVLALSGCLLPNDYSATVTLDSARTWTATFDGKATHLLAYQQYVQYPQLAAKSDEEMERNVRELHKVRGVKSAKHLGKGVLALSLEDRGTVAPGASAGLPLDFLRVASGADGREITLSSKEIPDREIRQVKGAGLTSVGDVCVRTPLRVIDHNADETPSKPGGCYLWKRFDVLSGKRLNIKVAAEG